MKKIILHKGKEKSLQRFHPWIFSGAVAKKDRNIQNGEIVEVLDFRGEFLAMGHYHDSSIVVRVFSFEPVLPTYDFWKNKMQKALEFRQSIGLINNPDTNMFRFINGEGDGMPGLIIDIYNGNAVLQFHSYGMYLLKETFVKILQELFPDLKSIYIRNNKSNMVQMDNLIDLNGGIAPPQLYRYNRFVSATVSAGLADGRTIGEGLEEMDRIAAETLDDTFRTALSGDSKEFRESSSSLMFAFLLAILLIYLILAAQFESFKDPIIIMLTVPLAIAGALIFMSLNDITMNIFSQIGIIMLIGLVAKNGILIVEFANQKQDAGVDKFTAICEAAKQRLRPILMTSSSTILGLIPLAFATGEGCNQRIAMGIAVVGGMLISTFMTMFVVPAIYSYISTDRSQVQDEQG